MAQRVDYAPIPNTQASGYATAINKMLGHAKRNRLTWRDYRDWLREQNLWSKEDMPLVLSLLDITTQPHVTLGPFAEKLFGAEKEEDAKALLYNRMRDLNIILTKQVMDVLDTERGGRLFSTHELYRMITSHLYEGDYIALTSFQAWIGWMEAAGILRYIGIRWGLSDAGKAAMPYVRNLDLEELLEDDRAERESGDVAVAVAVAAPPAAAAPAAQAVASAQVASSAVDDLDEELPDEFPEAAPPSELAAEAAVARLLAEEPAEAPAPAPAAPRRSRAASRASAIAEVPKEAQRVVAPVAQVAAAVAPAVPRIPVTPAVSFAQPAAHGLGAARLFAAPLDDAARDANARAIRDWWVGWPNKRLLRADDLGLHPKDYDRDRPLFLVKLATLGIACAQAMEAAAARSWFAALEQVRGFERIWKGQDSLEQVLADVGFFQADPAHLKLSEVLVHTVALMRRMRLNTAFVERWEAEKDPDALVRALHEDLLGGHFPLAAFWIVREMVAQKLWEAPELAAVTAVPTYRARENAYRLGFIDSLYAESFDALLHASRAIASRGLGQVPFDAALENLPDQLGCSFHCGRVYVCTYHCREKLGR